MYLTKILGISCSHNEWIERNQSIVPLLFSAPQIMSTDTENQQLSIVIITTT